MANTFKFGNGQWAVGKETALAYNDENSNFKPLPFSFDRGSIATVVNKNGLIETVGVDEPRIDFLNNTKGHLLLEPSRSNLFTYSDDFGNSDWDKGTGTITTNTSISPDGTLSADKYSAVSTSSFAFLSQTKSADASQSYTYSIWIKKVSGSGVLKLAISDVNLATSSSNNINLTNEFVRYSFSIETGDLSNTGSIGAGFTNITSGDVIEVWGAQLEAGSYATSYISTSGSAVTRSADSGEQNPPSDIINLSQGTLYLEFPNINNMYGFVGLSDFGSNSNRMIIYSSGDNILQAQFRQGGTVKLSGLTSAINGKVKAALAFSSTESVFYVNGTQIATGTASTWSALNQIDFNQANQYGAKIKDFKFYNTRLTNTELQALTS